LDIRDIIPYIPSMNALLIISHGSRRAASNTEVFTLTGRIRQSAGAALPLVECAFLEIAEPGVQGAIDRLVESGATNIQVFPHFLAAGSHVTTDIARELTLARETHEEVQFNLLPHLGSLAELPGLILTLSQSLRGAGPGGVL